jgi:hypothetical protein
LKKNLTEIAWSTVKNHWLANPVLPDSISRHPDFLAVISGLATTNQFEGIRNVLKNEAIIPVGTPYMAGYENLALSKLGEIEYMTNRVKKYWGGMLGLGATSFWEAYDEKLKTKEQYVFYNRPYAKSLCHAWSAGPVAILPSAYLGLQPIEDGWNRFSVNPNIGTLKWVSASIPTAFGLIILDINENNMTLNIPIGVVAEWKGESIKGPQIINRKLLE